MLSFSEQNRPNGQSFAGKKQFDYFVISNDTPNPPRVPSASHKNIVKTMNNKKPISLNKNKDAKEILTVQQKEFGFNVTQPKLFDEKLKRGGLAAEERRIQNELKKMSKGRSEDEFHVPYVVEKGIVASQQNRVSTIQKKKIEKAGD